VTQVLVVEDYDEARWALRELLRSEGFDVAEARNGSEALALLRSADAPKLVVLDREMPVMNGTELLRRMAESDELSRIPVIILSAYEHKPRAHEKVVACFTKPCDFDELMRSVRAHTAPENDLPN
jgi:CheY-like chemotaxis protein